MKRLLLLLAVAGCTADEPAVQAPADPVVVYASYADKTYLPARLSRFTKETGAAVIVRHAGREEIVDDLIADEIVPPADVVVTRSVRGAVRAADEGALRPLPKDAVPDSVPSSLRDGDGFWVALAYSTPVIVYDTRVAELPVPASLDALAEEHYRGRLCLSGSENLVNRTIIATLINNRGVRPAELLVRGWVANLATTGLDDEGDLLQAIEAGRCAVGIASSTAFLHATQGNSDNAMAAFAPAGAGIDVEAAGIGRHARNPDGAAALVAWLLDDEYQLEHSVATLQSPASDTVRDDPARLVSFDRAAMGADVTGVAWTDEEAQRLAERARFP
jgi:iron(III) transport system substrate-binding protein